MHAWKQATVVGTLRVGSIEHLINSINLNHFIRLKPVKSRRLANLKFNPLSQNCQLADQI